VDELHRRAGDRIVLLVSFVFAGTALTAVSSLPARRVEFDVLGSPLGFDLSGHLVVAVLLLTMCVAGVDGLVRSAPGLGGASLRYTSTFWVLPALITIAAVTAVPAQVGQPLDWFVAIGSLSALLATVVAAEYGTVATEGTPQRVARLTLNIAVYAAAFALYSSIYALRLRGLASGPVLIAITFLLAVELLRGSREQLGLTIAYAGVVALVIGELTVPLNWLGLTSLAGGAALVILFYAFGGICQQHLAGRLTPSVAAEFVTVAAIGLAFVALAG
jgi:hypothetical protein